MALFRIHRGWGEPADERRERERKEERERQSERDREHEREMDEIRSKLYRDSHRTPYGS